MRQLFFQRIHAAAQRVIIVRRQLAQPNHTQLRFNAAVCRVRNAQQRFLQNFCVREQARGRYLQQKPSAPPKKLESSPQWNDITMATKSLLPMSKFAQLTMAKGVISGKELYVLCDDPFTCDLCNETSVKQALAQAAQQVTGKNLRIKVLEESSIGTLSTKANPVDEVIRRAGELNINVEIND